jgi:phosphate transport system substrate-binding protein
MTPDQADACKGCLQLPWALAGTSIPYNVPGAPRHLKLTGTLLADIFLGRVAAWNDAAIEKLNPGTALHALRITPIFRSDPSGTTYDFTDYLAKVSSEWKTKVGTGTSVRFRAGTGAKGSSGVAGSLSRAKGGITYVDAAYSIANGFDYAALANRAGSFELPDRRAVAAAAAAVTSIPKDNVVSLVDPPASAAGAYPLSTFTYAVVPERTGKAAALRPFLRCAIVPGQRFAAALQFAELPPAILEANRTTIARIKEP